MKYKFNKDIILNFNDDIYWRLIRERWILKNYTLGIVLIGKERRKIPLWRIIRNQFNKVFDVEYKDGDRYNLKRDNLLLVFRKERGN